MNKETLLEVITLLNVAEYDSIFLTGKRDKAVIELKNELKAMNEFKPFAIGGYVRITKCMYGHEFFIGQEVKILGRDEIDGTLECSDGVSRWYVSEEEAVAL